MSDFKTVGQIMEGHFNKALDKVGMLPGDTKRLSELRFADCLLCHLTPHPTAPHTKGPGLRAEQYCNSCTCDMIAKTKVIDAKCPIGRW